MNVSARLVFAVFIFSFCSAAQAQNYYEIIKARYAQARVAPVAADFDRVGYPLKRMCLEVQATSPASDNLISIYRFTEIKEGRGPLLPDVRLEKIVFAEYANPNIELAKNVKTDFGRREVSSVLSDSEDYKHTLKVRKDGDLLVFERTEVSRTPSPSDESKMVTTTKVHYGYCYPPTEEIY